MQRFFKSAHYRKSEKEHLLSVWYSPLLFLLFFRGCRFCLFFSESYSKEILVRMAPRSANSKWGNLKNRRSSEKKVPFRWSLKWFFFVESLHFFVLETIFCQVKYSRHVLIFWSFWDTYRADFGPYRADSFVEAQSICGIAWIVYCMYSKKDFDWYLKDWWWLSSWS